MWFWSLDPTLRLQFLSIVYGLYLWILDVRVLGGTEAACLTTINNISFRVIRGENASKKTIVQESCKQAEASSNDCTHPRHGYAEQWHNVLCTVKQMELLCSLISWSRLSPAPPARLDQHGPFQSCLSDSYTHCSTRNVPFSLILLNSRVYSHTLAELFKSMCITGWKNLTQIILVLEFLNVSMCFIPRLNTQTLSLMEHLNDVPLLTSTVYSCRWVCHWKTGSIFASPWKEWGHAGACTPSQTTTSPPTACF